jgi:triosephosphate isomerase (TIM)
MRKNIVAGNWKMNTRLEDAIALAAGVEKWVSEHPSSTGVIIAPPFTHLTEVKKVIKNVSLASQNCAAEVSGAFTGEVSVDMLTSIKVQYVIIGHSERRAIYGETDAIIAKKVKLALNAGLVPIFCCGEVLSEREGNIHFDVVRRQVEAALFQLSTEEFAKVIIAYEPVWAIGTGVTASPAQAQEMHKFIRDTVVTKFGNTIADNLTILYGGSCKPSNAKELFANPDVDGGLIGGAALKVEDFTGIIQGF